MTDTERLDWLSRQRGAHFDEVRDSGPTLAEAIDTMSVMYRAGMRVRLFTVASQHVYGVDVRAAIDRAAFVGFSPTHSTEPQPQADATGYP